MQKVKLKMAKTSLFSLKRNDEDITPCIYRKSSLFRANGSINKICYLFYYSLS